MIDLEFLQKLIKAIDESGVDYIEIERGGTHIRVGKTPPPAPVVANPGASPAPHAPPSPASSAAPAPGAAAAGETPAAPEEAEPAASAASNLVEVKSPMVGTFYRSPSPNDDPYVEVGATVAKGDALCIIEAMKLMNELEAEAAGTVVEICVENAQPVEYGQVLFRLEPA